MKTMEHDNYIIGRDELILITGAAGFIGSRVVETLLDRGFRNLRCLVRPSSAVARLEDISLGCRDGARVEIVRGNLISREDCAAATKGVAVILHLAAGRGEKSVPDAFINSVVTTRNLLEAAIEQRCMRRFVNISSFSVYSNRQKPHGRLLDESSPIEKHPELHGDAYHYAKVRQEEMVADYGQRFGLPYVIIRPGFVYGPGNEGITGRVGVGTFGIFLHFGGSNTIPFTYVDNCADAIALTGLKKGIDGHVFNVVDDDLPSSRQFLRLYKRNVRAFASLYVPHFVSYVLCWLWERYSIWSEEQLPQVFSRWKWHTYWKQTRYSNAKLKSLVGWSPRVPTSEGLKRYFQSCRNKQYA